MGSKTNLITLIIETVAKYNRATTKPYQKIQHVMTKESEILVPSDNDEYVFRLDEGWKIKFQNSMTIIIEKK